MPSRSATRPLHSWSAWQAMPPVSAAAYSTTRSRAGSRGVSSGTGEPSPGHSSNSRTAPGTSSGSSRAAVSDRGRSTYGSAAVAARGSSPGSWRVRWSHFTSSARCSATESSPAASVSLPSASSRSNWARPRASPSDGASDSASVGSARSTVHSTTASSSTDGAVPSARVRSPRAAPSAVECAARTVGSPSRACSGPTIMSRTDSSPPTGSRAPGAAGSGAAPTRNSSCRTDCQVRPQLRRTVCWVSNSPSGGVIRPITRPTAAPSAGDHRGPPLYPSSTAAPESCPSR